MIHEFSLMIPVIFSVGKGGITLSESGNHDKLALLNSLIGSMCCHDLNGK
jgi:hypothetical protein